ncbi:nuclear factor of kappa light polypeptide gene enhancer in B-cells inhibitor, alpha b isoform X2 [Osmerus eperlanus]|uniref:nuclear factor of kappa light polypeptide gene enhancer in B-cells inhibitor, alpha b isoform X2 n=1 Tax=Osmerus eperlanus TaxID=29151 RepID=UPI002E115E51
MDKNLYRTSIRNNMDYKGDGSDCKEGKVQPSTEERLDSGLDSLKEEEYQEVAGELERLRVDCAPQKQRPERHDGSQDLWKMQVSEDGDTLLHLAIIHEAKDCAKKMIQLSRNEPFLNLQNYQRQTALHLAVITEQPELVDCLLGAGADPSMVDMGGNSPLHIACRGGSLACFSLLTQTRPGSGSNPGANQLAHIMATNNYSGQNCLHLVSLHGFLSLVENLVALGADINAQEQCNGRSSLHLAVDLQDLDLVRLLLRKGANPNSLTYGGHSPYHLTYGRHNDTIRQELLALTNPELRELPDSESEDSEEEEEDGQSEEDEVEYDDIQWNGH